MPNPDPPKPISCDEEAVVPSILSITIRGEFDDTRSAKVKFGRFVGGIFEADDFFDVQNPTQVEYDRIRVPVRIHSGTFTEEEEEAGRGERYVRVVQAGVAGISERPILRMTKGEE